MGEGWINCNFIKHSVYIGYTYRMVSIKVLGDHKVHSAVLLSLPGIDLTTVLVKGLLVLTSAATDELDTSASVVLVDVSCFG